MDSANNLSLAFRDRNCASSLIRVALYLNSALRFATVAPVSPSRNVMSAS